MKTITRTSKTTAASPAADILHTPKITGELKTGTAQDTQDDNSEQENHELAFRSFLKMLVDHFTNGKLTAYTFYY
jgi:hypothetical protein